MRYRHLNSAGDTIVEVLIVLAVLGLAISVSYATANKSLLNGRQAQENSEATALVQSQIEILRTIAGNANIFTNHLFCVNTDGSVVTDFSGPTATTLSGLINPSYSEYPDNCTRGLYHIAIEYTSSPEDTFTVQAKWDDARGDGQDSVRLSYRLHKP